MAQDTNIVILIGRLTRESDLKSTNNGGMICKFSLASNRNIYNRQTQESRDEVGYFECTLFGKSAEAFHKYTKKGSKVCVTGNLRWSSWDGTDGKKNSKVEINVEGFQFLDAKQGDGAQTSGGAAAFDSGAMSDEEPPF